MRGICPNHRPARGAYVDILLLNGQGGNYPAAANYYVRIAKTDLTF